MRLFVAIAVGEETIEECRRLQGLLPDEGLTKTVIYHVTLKFFGEMTPSQTEDIKKALVTIHERKFVLTTTGIGVFPTEKQARVIWLGIDDGSHLSMLHQKIDNATSSLGFALEKDFHAHITLARVKFLRKGLTQQLKEIRTKKTISTISSFVLYESIRTGRRLEYKELLTVPLT